ncbi:MAG: ADP-ribosylation factor-like protein, partial [Promethearchaeota archaeon]
MFVGETVKKTGEKKHSSHLWSGIGLIVPGTTIGVSLIPGYVEIRDKGIVKKKIPTKHRSFYAILEEVEMYFRARRKLLAPGTIKDVLIRIGLPEAKKIVTKDDVEAIPKKPKEKPEPEKPELEAEPEKAIEEETTPIKEKTAPKPAAKSSEDTTAKPDILTGTDFQDIEEALSAVESLSDSFMSPTGKETTSDDTKPHLSIDLSGTTEVVSASSSFATTRTMNGQASDAGLDQAEEAIEEAHDIAVEVEEGEEVEAEASSPFVEIEAFTVDESISEEPEKEIADLDILEPEPSVPEEKKRPAPAHVVKPLVSSKILILGEDGVGKSSLMEKANLELTELEGELADRDLFARGRVFETDYHRMKIQVWSFAEAVQAKVSRKEFYRDAQVLIIVYSASDRWSFDSIDFWLKEATITQDAVPPIVVVANKMDLVKES